MHRNSGFRHAPFYPYSPSVSVDGSVSRAAAAVSSCCSGAASASCPHAADDGSGAAFRDVSRDIPHKSAPDIASAPASGSFCARLAAFDSDSVSSSVSTVKMSSSLAQTTIDGNRLTAKDDQHHQELEANSRREITEHQKPGPPSKRSRHIRHPQPGSSARYQQKPTRKL